MSNLNVSCCNSFLDVAPYGATQRNLPGRSSKLDIPEEEVRHFAFPL